jgi:hypothetical protein
MVFGGGGFYGLVYVGVLRYLYQEGLDKSIKTVAGTSVGAMFATFFVLGMSCDEVEMMAYNWDETCISFGVSDIVNLPEKLGLISGESFVSKLKERLQNMTFLDVSKKSGKDLVICATHVATMKPVYFSVDTTPHVRVIDALRASTAIPLIVAPVQIGDDFYIDGFVTHDMPFKSIEKNILSPKNVLLIRLAGIESPNFEYASNKTNTNGKFTSLINYVLYIINAVVYSHQVEQLVSSIYPHFILIKNIPVQQMSIKMNENHNRFNSNIPDKKIIDECIMLGYKALHDHFMHVKNQ